MHTNTHSYKNILVLMSIKTRIYIYTCYTFEYFALSLPYSRYNILTQIIYTNTIWLQYCSITYNCTVLLHECRLCFHTMETLAASSLPLRQSEASPFSFPLIFLWKMSITYQWLRPQRAKTIQTAAGFITNSLVGLLSSLRENMN